MLPKNLELLLSEFRETRGLPSSKPTKKPDTISSESWLAAIYALRTRDKKFISRLLKKGLSEDQVRVFDQLVDWVAAPSEQRPFFILKGYAGTGKSFLILRLKTYCEVIYPNLGLLFTAPTNKAVKVIRSMGNEAKTIYSALKITMSEDEDQMVLSNKPLSNDLGIADGSMLCVDETSWLTKSITSKIVEAQKRLHLKVLFMGDPAQIGPIQETRSPAWDLAVAPDLGILKKVLRFDNEILNLTVDVRREIKKAEKGLPIKSMADLVKPHLGYGSSIRKMSIANNITEFVENDMAEHKIIAWRNRTVDEYNRLVRSTLDYKEEFCVGELVMLKSPMTEELYGRKRIVAYTDDEFKVRAVRDSHVKFDSTFVGSNSIPCFKLQTEELELVVPRSDDTSYDDVLNKMAQSAKACSNIKERTARWKEFWNLRNSFNPVRYGYSQSAHRSQGSTYKSVWVDASDIFCNRNLEEKLQCFYVAVSRPTTSLVVT